MRSGLTRNAERYVERFTLTRCSEKLVIMHTNVSLRIREDLDPSSPLHASPAELPTHDNREKGGLTLIKTLKWERSIE